MGATLSKLSSVTSRNSLRSDFPNTVPSSMPSPTSSPPSSPIRSIPWRQSRSGRLSHEKPITRVTLSQGGKSSGWPGRHAAPAAGVLGCLTLQSVGDIGLGCGYRLNTEPADQYVQQGRGEENRQSRAEPDIAHAQGKQRQEHRRRLLLEPRHDQR